MSLSAIAWRFSPQLVEDELSRLLPEPCAGACDDGCAPLNAERESLRRAMRHAVFGGGKRLRSQLVMESSGTVGGEAQAALPFACAIEFIHAYSLAHDDLPAMDNADTRRGRPSCHKAFGEATAILVGDALLTLAFEVMTLPDDAPARQLQAIALVAKAAGEAGMVGGQQMDIAWSQEHVTDISTAQLLQMHALKTGALIRAACEAGALVGGGTLEQIAALREYGTHLGRAYQIHDDVLDVEGDPTLMGKASTDAQNFKTTAPAVFGLDKAKLLACEARDSAVRALEPFGQRGEALRQLACFAVERKS